MADMAKPQTNKFGVVNPDKYDNYQGFMSDSEVLKAKGCNIIVKDSSGYFDMAAATTSLCYGVIISHSDETSSSTAGGTAVTYIPAQSFPKMRMKVLTGTVAQSDVGKTCDLVLSSSVMGVNVDASTYDPIMILEVDVTNNEIVGTFNPANLTGYTGTV
jgi:hypothetical protein